MGISVGLIKALNNLGIEASEAEYSKRGYHVEVSPTKDQVRAFARVMLEMEFYLDFVTAVHIKEGLQAVYQFGHFTESCHVNAKAITNNKSIKTISDIFDGANWHERETHDFYGLEFEDHNDLRVLILDESDSELNPLLKSEDKLMSLDGVTRKPAKKEAKEA